MPYAMGYPDIERARADHAALKSIFDGYVGEAADPRTLRRVHKLCRDLAEAMEDEYCSAKALAIEEYGAELLSGASRARGDFLRQQIRAGLELVQSRLYSLERMRRLGAQGAFGLRPQYAGKR